MSYAVWMKFRNEPACTNACRYATASEADNAGHELLSRWFVPVGFEVRESTDPVNYAFVDGRPQPLKGNDNA